MDGAQEIDVGAVAQKGTLTFHSVSEHLENAGVHSGDATLVLPPYTLPELDMARPKTIVERVCAGFDVSRPFNRQVVSKLANESEEETGLNVTECHLRALRSFPFGLKVLGPKSTQTATKAVVGVDVREPVDVMAQEGVCSYQGCPLLLDASPPCRSVPWSRDG